MFMLTSNFRTACVLLLALVPPVCVAAQDDDQVVRLTIHPSAEAKPALKFQLLPPFADRIKGNAAVYYGKVTAEQIQFFSNKELLEKFEKLRSAPLDELRKGEVVQIPRTVQYHLERAARCEYCDWQLPLREEPFYEILLPDLQQSREFARLLATQARIQIARGQFDEAIKTLQSGFAIGQHAAAGETIINGLVGIAVSAVMFDQVTQFIQQPDAPNLYWALTMLRRPWVDMRRALEAEMNAVAFTFPELRNIETAQHSPEEWRQILMRFWQKIESLVANNQPSAASTPEAITALCFRGFPAAKERLIGQGMPREKVEAMPVAQVVLIDTMRTFEELRDELCKWFYVPYSEADDGLSAAEQKLQAARVEGREVLPLASALLPAIGAVRARMARMDQQIDELRVIEALRIYAAGHEGQLPKQLSDVTAVPVPLDPAANKPFEYRLEGDTAHLQGSEITGKRSNYEIKIARP